MLDDIRHAINQWKLEQNPQRTGAVMKRKVAREIAVYLGPRAAARVLGGVSGSGENLLSTIEPVLALFLGGRAAACLVDRVVDSVLVRS